MKTIFSLLLSLSLAACSHTQEKAKLEHTLVQLQCKDALKKDPFRNFTDASVETTEYLGKKVLAYSYIVGSYTTEVLWDVTAGTVLVVGLCAPAVIIATATRPSFHGPNFPCLVPAKGVGAVFAPPLGRKSITKTQRWRCPDYEPLLETLQKVIACQKEKDTPENLNKALQTLDNLESSDSFYSCLTEPQMLALQEQRSSLQKRLAELEVGVKPPAKSL